MTDTPTPVRICLLKELKQEFSALTENSPVIEAVKSTIEKIEILLKEVPKLSSIQEHLQQFDFPYSVTCEMLKLDRFGDIYQVEEFETLQRTLGYDPYLHLGILCSINDKELDKKKLSENLLYVPSGVDSDSSLLVLARENMRTSGIPVDKGDVLEIALSGSSCTCQHLSWSADSLQHEINKLNLWLVLRFNQS